MGEMADFSNEYQEETVNQLDRYKSGEMNLDEAYDLGILNEMGIEINNGDTSKTCRCCNKSGLTWGQISGKWLLFDNGALHDCLTNKLR